MSSFLSVTDNVAQQDQNVRRDLKKMVVDASNDTLIYILKSR